MTSPAAVRRMLTELGPAQPRIGVVTAVASGSVSVSLGADAVVPGLQYATSYVPAVRDQVLVVPTSSSWVVTGKITPRPRVLPDEEVTVGRVAGWHKLRPVNWGGGPGAWSYQAAGALTYSMQGRGAEASGADDGSVQQRMSDRASVMYWGPLAALVPSGSTITGVSLLLRRTPTGASEPPLTGPVLHGHAYTPGSPPLATAAPASVAGFGPLAYPGVAQGELTRITLPSAWVTAWLAGTITGLTLYSDRTADAALFEVDQPGDLTVTYTPPA